MTGRSLTTRRSGQPRAFTIRLAAFRAVMIGCALLTLPWAAPVFAQDTEPKTRAEVIEQKRREKRALLWPERTSPISEIANGLVERGLLDGVTSGMGGGNGIQFVLGGMRSGQGMSVGVGYRRSDLWNDRFGFRTTVRGTPQYAWMIDTQLYFPHLYTERGFLDIYAKYEYSPLMDYYGEGPNSSLEDRSAYKLEDTRLIARGGWEFYDFLRIGGTGGAYVASTRSHERSSVPSIEDVFDPDTVPGLFEHGEFIQAGVFVQANWLDHPSGPRSGGNYRLEWNRYWDLTGADQYNFRQIDGVIEQYFPYFNKTRVIAIHIQGTWSFVDDGQQVPFYLQPTLGGNDDLRAFQRYRFYANNRFYANIEHRWHAFSGMDVAVFVDLGKVSNLARELYSEDMRFNGGIGFRFKLRDTVIMRIDQAYGNEGYRFMWTFSNIF